MLALQTAAQKLGSIAALAKALGVTDVAIHKWKSSQIPPERCPEIERATDGEVRCEQLRPDLVWDRDKRGKVAGYRVALKLKAKAA